MVRLVKTTIKQVLFLIAYCCIFVAIFWFVNEANKIWFPTYVREPIIILIVGIIVGAILFMLRDPFEKRKAKKGGMKT